MLLSGRPVVAGAFHGREEPLARLLASLPALRAGHARWFALIGRRKVGKTSLLLELARRADVGPEPLRFVVMDVAEVSPVSLDVLRLLGLRTLDAFLGSAAGRSFEALATDPAAFRAALAPQLAHVPADLHGLLLELPGIALTPAVLRQIAQLPQVLAAHLGGHVVVALDEFQELMALPKRGRRDPVEPIALLRSVWQRHDRVAYIVSGSSPSMLKRLVSDRASPFFQHLAVMELGEEVEEDGCTWFAQALPRGEPLVVRVLGGSCEIEAFALRESGALLLRAGAVESVGWNGVVDRTPPEGRARAVAYAPDGAAMVLTADTVGGAPFVVRTWVSVQDAWLARETTTEDVWTSRAVTGGPIWAARLPGASVDRWALEGAPGFELHLPGELPLPRRLDLPEAVMWGPLPVGERALAVRYAMLGGPSPVGPVLIGDGRRWRLLDDSRFLEWPAAVEVRGDYLLLTYEGWNPLVVDLRTGREVLRGPGWSGAHLTGRSIP